MVANAQKPVAPPLARAETPPADYGGLRRILASVLLLLVLGLVWEGLKAFASGNGYELNVLGATIDLTIFNDQQLPHLGTIAGSFFEPAQRNGPPLYTMLLEASLFTLQMAVGGFLLGSIIGFLLAVLFAHSRLMQGGCLPYVVASQTVPVLAIAPMIVIWLGRAGYQQLSIPVISAFLTFFPVVIYTLRGLTAVPPTALELMDSYAASKWDTLIKLRLPNALPHIFTALKLSATARIAQRLPERLRDRHPQLCPLLQPIARTPVGNHRHGGRGGRVVFRRHCPPRASGRPLETAGKRITWQRSLQ
jgi:ABC-type nitrate/sulfonate/bicarbonate transport system permease component